MFRTVIFDCDSTLSAIEGIEELARDHRQEVARLTELAMRGEVPLDEVYGRRLDLVRPGRADLERVGRLYVTHLVPGAERVVRELAAAGIAVRILSGGLAPAVLILGLHLGLGPEAVAAVDVHFDAEGKYAGFDTASPLGQAGGKRRWIAERRSTLAGPILLVGDGATDLEARPAVDCFAAFAGVTRREPVLRGADVVIQGPGLDQVLSLALAGPGAGA